MFILKLSVLISVYHKEKASYFSESLLSVYNQTHQADEVVIVHDGPLTKELYSVLDVWKIKLPIVEVKLENNVGLGRALNIGLSHCKFDLIARADTDDINVETRFEKQIACFNNIPDLAVCGSVIKEVEQQSLDLISFRNVKEFSDSINDDVLKRNPFNHMTVMFRKSFIMKVGGYQDMTSMEDWYLWLRVIADKQVCYNIQEPLVIARTGLQLMVRRSGFNYVKYEFNIAKAKLSLFPGSFIKIIFYFLMRSFPRVLPKKILSFVYKISRVIT